VAYRGALSNRQLSSGTRGGSHEKPKAGKVLQFVRDQTKAPWENYPCCEGQFELGVGMVTLTKKNDKEAKMRHRGLEGGVDLWNKKTGGGWRIVNPHTMPP